MTDARQLSRAEPGQVPFPDGDDADQRQVLQQPPAEKVLAAELGVVSYKTADDFVVTPAIGSMSTGLHPFLALWAVLLVRPWPGTNQQPGPR
jgi:hypothetical protein